MESVAYLINNKFILVAVDTNFETSFNGLNFRMENAKKIHKLNDTTVISVIGNPYKISDIYKYVLQLNKLGHNKSFESIVNDIKDVFNSSNNDFKKNLKEINDIIPKFKTKSDHLDTNALFDHLKERPELISFLQDSISSVNNSMPMLSQLLVLGWKPDIKSTKLSHFVSIGLNLTGNEFDDFKKDLVYARFASATLNPAETTKIETELVQELTPLLSAGWDNNTETIKEVIDKGKIVLTKGLEQITPYKSKPNVVFYELSPRTNYIFEEPDKKLVKIEFNRNK